MQIQTYTRSTTLLRSISFVNAFVQLQPWPSSLSAAHRKPGWTTGNCCLLKSLRPDARASGHNGDDLHVSADLRPVTSLTVRLRRSLEKRLRFAKSVKIALYPAYIIEEKASKFIGPDVIASLYLKGDSLVKYIS